MIPCQNARNTLEWFTVAVMHICFPTRRKDGKVPCWCSMVFVLFNSHVMHHALSKRPCHVCYPYLRYVACMNPTAGSFIINPRLQRLFMTLAMDFPGQDSLMKIYGTFLQVRMLGGRTRSKHDNCCIVCLGHSLAKWMFLIFCVGTIDCCRLLCPLGVRRLPGIHAHQL